MSSSKIPQQIIPLTIIFLILVGSFIAVRTVFVPESFGELGHYRSKAIGENADKELVYAGYEACYDCHDEIYEKKQQSNHSMVSCEVCHGPALAHIDAPDEVIPPAPRERGYCPLCHGYNAARPSGFPQILPDQHNPGRPCMTCHDPHEPVLPHAPENCSACHRQISRSKMVSYHTALSCDRCHEVTKEHTINPRENLAQKPVSRELCGECHDKGSKMSKSATKIDLSAHNERYLCWECHYPHSPEANK